MTALRPAVASDLKSTLMSVGVVVTLAGGQSRFAFPGVPRARYATGQQEPCTDCAAAGLDGRGVSRDGPGSAALCLGCWRRRQRREPRRGLTPEESGWLAELAEHLACETCRPDPASTPEVDLPPAAVQARRHERRRQRARGQDRPWAPRRTGCWRCGDASWVASARAVHAGDQALAAVDVERVDELRGVHQVALGKVTRAERRLAYVQAWRERVAAVVEAGPKLTKTGSKGRLQLKRGPGALARPVWLIADFLARMAADRAVRGLSSRGRPPLYPLVVGVMAIAADPAAGRRSMAGLKPTAAFAGVTAKTVSTGWAYSEQVGATECLEVGRTCSLAELEETGLRRRRSVYDFTPLHTSPFDPGPFLGAAAAVVARLLQRAVQLVDEHQAELADARRAVAAVEADLLDAQAVVAERTAEDLKLQAFVSEVWADDARQAVTAAVAARARATRAMAPPVDAGGVVAAQRAGRAGRDGVVATVHTAFDLAIRMASFYHPPRSGSRKRSSSGLRGYLLFSAQPTSLVAGQRPDGRGERHNGGAPRPAPTRDVTGQTGSTRPRTVYGVRRVTPATSRRCADLTWAKELVTGLARRWECVQRYLDDSHNNWGGPLAAARQRGLRRRQLAGVLAAQLSPDWSGHAADLADLVERYAGIRSIIAAGDAHSLLRYIKIMLRRALTNPNAVVRWHSPIRDAYERDVLAVEYAATADRSAAIAVELAAAADAAAAERAGPRTARAAARAAAALAGGRILPRPTRPGDHGDAARIAAARAELAQKVPARTKPTAVAGWPAVARPGRGVKRQDGPQPDEGRTTS